MPQSTLYSPNEILTSVGQRARALRVNRRKRQSDLAASAGIALTTLKRFERGDRVGFDVVARVALALGCDQGLVDLFPVPDPRSIDDILRAQRKPQRVRKPS
jgi:transcriptional regulator with XRE-family HTH domain